MPLCGGLLEPVKGAPRVLFAEISFIKQPAHPVLGFRFAAIGCGGEFLFRQLVVTGGVCGFTRVHARLRRRRQV